MGKREAQCQSFMPWGANTLQPEQASQLQLPALGGSLCWRPSCHSPLGPHLQLSLWQTRPGVGVLCSQQPGAPEAASHKPLRWRHLCQIPHISGTGSGGEGVLNPTSNSEMTWLLQNPLLPWNSSRSSFYIHSFWSFSPPLSPSPHPLPPWSPPQLLLSLSPAFRKITHPCPWAPSRMPPAPSQKPSCPPLGAWLLAPGLGLSSLSPQGSLSPLGWSHDWKSSHLLHPPVSPTPPLAHLPLPPPASKSPPGGFCIRVLCLGCL